MLLSLSFYIIKPDALIEFVLFTTKQTRQLNIWGFTRLSDDGSNGRTWEHKHFIRGRVESLSSIERREVKNCKPKTKSHQPKNSKPKQRRATTTALNANRRVTIDIASLENVDVSLTVTKETANLSIPQETPYYVPPIINAPLNALLSSLSCPTTRNSDLSFSFNRYGHALQLLTCVQ